MSKPYPFPMVYRLNLKSENFQDYAQKPLRHCTFMNLASGHSPFNPLSTELEFLKSLWGLGTEEE